MTLHCEKFLDPEVNESSDEELDIQKIRDDFPILKTKHR